jgi:hypothetical protein
MAVTGYTGGSAYIIFGTTVLNTYYRTASPSEEIELVDKSAGADANKTYLTALKDGTMDVECVMESGTAGTALWGALVPGTSGTLEWGPEGTATNKPKHTVTAIVRSRGKPLTYNDVSTFSVSFQFSGAITNTAY